MKIKKLIVIAVLLLTMAACKKIKQVKFDITADSNCVTVTVCPDKL